MTDIILDANEADEPVFIDDELVVGKLVIVLPSIGIVADDLEMVEFFRNMSQDRAADLVAECVLNFYHYYREQLQGQGEGKPKGLLSFDERGNDER